MPRRTKKTRTARALSDKQTLKALVPFSFKAVPRGILYHDADLFHRDVLEALSLQPWTKFLCDLTSLRYAYNALVCRHLQNQPRPSLAQRSQLLTNVELYVREMGGVAATVHLVGESLRHLTFQLFSEYCCEWDRSVYTNLYLSQGLPVWVYQRHVNYAFPVPGHTLTLCTEYTYDRTAQRLQGTWPSRSRSLQPSREKEEPYQQLPFRSLSLQPSSPYTEGPVPLIPYLLMYLFEVCPAVPEDLIRLWIRYTVDETYRPHWEFG